MKGIPGCGKAPVIRNEVDLEIVDLHLPEAEEVFDLGVRRRARDVLDLDCVGLRHVEWFVGYRRGWGKSVLCFQSSFRRC